MRLWTAVLLVPLVLCVAACGSSSRLSKAAYKTKLNATIDQMGSQLAAAYRPLFPSLDKPIAPTSCVHLSTRPVCTAYARRVAPVLAHRVASQIKSAVGKAADTLASLEPPANVAADNAKLVTGLRTGLGPYFWSLAAIGVGAPASIQSFQKSPRYRTFSIAIRDLQRQGYGLSSYAFITRPKLVKGAQPKQVTPRPFSLVSEAGTQAAAGLHAETAACQSNGSATSCFATLYLEASTGPLPNGLSVVRPRARIRFVLPSGTRPLFPHTPLAYLDVSDLCNPNIPPLVNTSLDKPVWKVRLKPGAYVATLSFSWEARHGRVNESGIVGLLVSRTDRLRMLAKPRCA